ncbi:MAG: hypothetical protein Ta2F_01940 [Termitinemataceae bacterium]|nr:MAG: hypothetical protein Ta2F_01940 [Termitinemataceae bacterium]
MKKNLSEFFNADTFQAIGFLEKTTGSNADPVVCSLVYDSREVTSCSLYFALQGLHVDGHDYIDMAVEKGATVIVHQHKLQSHKDGVVYIRVTDSRFAMSPIAAAFYDYPSKKMAVIGVTGTEGKSTTVYLIFQLLRLAGKKAGFISTVQYSIDGIEHSNKEHQTTPEATVIQKRLWQMCQNGVEYAVIESSSHGLSKKTNRLGDVFFDAAIMTNVTHEHLEFHGTWEQYQSDKANLFRALDNEFHKKKQIDDVPRFGIVNADDKSAPYFIKCTKHKVQQVSTQGKLDSDFVVTRIDSNSGGNIYDLSVKENGEVLHITDNLSGAFNAANTAYAVICVSQIAQIPLHDLIPLVPKLQPVHGRMTAINEGQDFEVIVDYAHTPSSFEAIFPPIKNRLQSGKKIISVFGSAGERDTKKRPKQGAIAAQYSDIIILCDEDPRGEQPMDILKDIAKGIPQEKFNCNAKNLFLIPDRPAAIKKAFSLASKGDIVLLLGKGHENSIIYSTEGCSTIEYDECKCARTALKEHFRRSFTSKIIFLPVPETLRGEHFHTESGVFRIDPNILIPVEVLDTTAKTATEISIESIISAMLQVVSGGTCAHSGITSSVISYYKDFIKAAHPALLTELSGAAIAKTGNGDYDSAVEICRLLLGVFPDSGQALFINAITLEEKAESLERAGKDTEAREFIAKTEAAYKAATEGMSSEALPQALFNAGFFYVKNQDYAKAKECFLRYIPVAEDEFKKMKAQKTLDGIKAHNLDDSLYKEAHNLIKSDNADDTEAGMVKLHQFLAKNPKVWNAWFMLGWALRKMKRWEDAGAAFKQALELGADTCDTRNELAICLIETGDYKAAQRQLEKALSIESENIKIISNLAVLALKQGQKDKAAGFFRTILEIDGTDPLALRFFDCTASEQYF